MLSDDDFKPEKLYTGEPARLNSLKTQRPPFDVKNPYMAPIKVRLDLADGYKSYRVGRPLIRDATRLMVRRIMVQSAHWFNLLTARVLCTAQVKCVC